MMNVSCAFMPGKNDMATVLCVAIATQYVTATDRIDCSIFPSVAF